ncbi:MAG: hypothetical protein Q9219_001756 [cf. Caloplaca sp. 3 TL-2023]
MAATRQICIYEDASNDLPLLGSSEDVRPLLDPTIPASDGRSPLKTIQAKTPPLNAASNRLKNVSFPPPLAPTFTTDSPTKQSQIAFCYPATSAMTENPLLGSLPTWPGFDQENPEHLHHSDNLARFPDPVGGYNLPKARRAAADLETSRSPKSTPADVHPSTQPQLPQPLTLPSVEDNGKKPPFSYAQLIGMAILRAPDRRLTLAQIYKWISDTFSFYGRSATGWQNSIRHNLSISDAFTKQERHKNDPGKGNYWIIVPGKEDKFLRQKTSRRSQAGGPVMKTFSQPLNEPSSTVWSTPVNAQPKSIVQPSKLPQQPSSDATVPASDTIAPENLQQGDADTTPGSYQPLSSPAPEIGSSPPLATADGFPEGSPLLNSDALLPTSETRSRKRHAAAMDDSGYFSSLESSTARRPGTAKDSVDRQTGQPCLKRGRAEEEIARIRSSSYESSPSKKSWRFPEQPPPQLASSSPFRGLDDSLVLAPLTPSLTFKFPSKPPASVSPNTNLRNHRNQIKALVGSPIRDAGALHSDTAYSPMFNINDDHQGVFDEALQSTLDIFADIKRTPYSCRVSPSPGKQSTNCRNRLARPSKTSGALSNVTGTQLNRKAFTPISNASYTDSPSRSQKQTAKSRLKDVSYGSLLRDNAENEVFFNLDCFADADNEDNEQENIGGLDILQGFQKIGGSQKPIIKANRPTLGARSQTSRF